MTAGPLLLGVDVGGTKVDLALATPDRSIVERRLLRTNAAEGADQVVRRACGAARSLVEAYGGRLVAVGVASPGISLPDRVLLAPNIAGWGALRVVDAVRAGLDGLVDATVPVVVANDVKAGALAELRTAALRGVRNGVYLNLGTGVALAAVVDGRVLEGAHGAAGEIAYVHTGPGQPGAADDRAPLEELVGGRALDTLATRLAGRPTTVVEVLRSGDAGLRTALEPALEALDVALVNACCLLDPEVVAVAGGLMGAADVLLARFRTALERGTPFPPSVVAAHHVADAPLVGALLLAAETYGGPAPSTDGSSTDGSRRLTTKELA